MANILNIINVPDGDYTVIEFEGVGSTYGDNFIITAIPIDSNEYCCITCEKDKIRFYSPCYMSRYIVTKDPTKKFNITINDGIVSIDGYYKKRILK